MGSVKICSREVSGAQHPYLSAEKMRQYAGIETLHILKEELKAMGRSLNDFGLPVSNISD